MPSEDENVQYLYLVLTSGGPPTLDMTAISQALNLSMGATSKRWSRLRQAMDAGKNPGPSAYELLWLCAKHSTRDKAMDWADIAKKCGTTPGAASKRYSRMKLAFAKGDAAPVTPSKPKNTAEDVPESPNNATPSTKRKRATPAKPKKKANEDNDNIKLEPNEDDDDECAGKISKRTKTTPSKPRATPKPKPNNKSGPQIPIPTHSGSVNPTEATTLIKTNPDAVPTQSNSVFHDTATAANDGEEEHFYDANEVQVGEEAFFTQERLQDWLEEI